MAASALPLPAPARQKTVLVTANKGGCGKTTTCVHLLTAAAHRKLNVVGIDLDLQHNFAKWAKRRPPGMNPVTVIEGTMEGYQQALARAEDYDLVIIDTPPGIDAHLMEATALARLADLVLIPTSIDVFDLEVVVPYAAALGKSRGSKAHFVLNRIDTRIMNAEVAEAQATLARAGRVSPMVIPTLIDISRYMRGGMSLLDISAKRGVTNINGVWNYVSEEVGLG